MHRMPSGASVCTEDVCTEDWTPLLFVQQVPVRFSVPYLRLFLV